MEALFADTGYWMALLNSRDALHQKALKATREFDRRQIITCEMVLAELLNAYSGLARRANAAKLVSGLRASHNVIVVPQTSDIFDRAFRMYQDAHDKQWSLTDCASFSIMRERQIARALTHDHHFTQAGFQALLR
jgi:uncharacterized protein